MVALVLLFPSRNEKGEKSRDFLTVEPHEISEKVYYLRQLEGHLDNACGTIAMIHGILNNRDILGVTGANCVAASPVQPLPMELLDSLSVHSKMSLLHSIVGHILKQVRKQGERGIICTES